jgi:hypothetical protein
VIPWVAQCIIFVFAKYSNPKDLSGSFLLLIECPGRLRPLAGEQASGEESWLLDKAMSLFIMFT